MNVSSRVPPNLEPNRLARLIAAHPPQYDLTQSNPTHAGFDYPAELLDALSNPAALRYDPDSRGLLTARDAIAAYYTRAVPPERILLTSSTSESYSWLFKLLCDPGDRVLVPRPSYPLFECLAHLESVEVAQYPLIERLDWAIDFETLESLATPRTRALVFVNPNNPTGSYLKRWELDTLVDFCRRHDLALISDEVFSPYAFRDDPTHVRSLAAENRCPVFALNGLSKPAGLPQMKLGWIVAPSEAIPRLEWIADAYLPVSAPIQHAAPAWLRLIPQLTAQIRTRITANLDTLTRAFAGTAARLLPVEAGWAAILELPRIRSEDDWVAAILEKGTLVQPGYLYDFDREALVVLSLLPQLELFQAGVSQVRIALSEAVSE